MIVLNELSAQAILQNGGTVAVIVKHVFLYITNHLDC